MYLGDHKTKTLLSWDLAQRKVYSIYSRENTTKILCYRIVDIYPHTLLSGRHLKPNCHVFSSTSIHQETLISCQNIPKIFVQHETYFFISPYPQHKALVDSKTCYLHCDNQAYHHTNTCPNKSMQGSTLSTIRTTDGSRKH